KSAKAWPGFDVTSAASGEAGPNTVGMSMAVFSRIVFAVATAPKSQPASVNGTHGAGAILPFSLIISGVVSVVEPAGSKSGAVQYANETPVRVVPSVLKYRNEFDTGWPMRSGYTPVSDVRIPVAVC